MENLFNMDPYKVVIIDDEKSAIDNLCIRLTSFPNFKIVATFQSVSEALIKLSVTPKVDVIFLDIKMRKYTGFDFIRQYQPDHMPLIIFITAFDHFAVKAFDHHAFDYLLKPINKVRFEEMIQKVTKHLQQEELLYDAEKLSKMIEWYEFESANALMNTIKIQSMGVYHVLDKKKINWIEANGDYINIYTTDRKYLVRSGLQKFVRELEDMQFKQIHRSSVVNIRFINEIIQESHSDAIILLKDGTRIKMSRRHKKEILNLFGS